MPVAIEVARKLKAPLDFVFVRRIGIPGRKEVAMATVVDGATPELVLNYTGGDKRSPQKEADGACYSCPLAPSDAVDALRSEVDVLVCLQTPEPFYAVGLHYKDFHQVDDDEITEALRNTSLDLLFGV